MIMSSAATFRRYKQAPSVNTEAFATRMYPALPTLSKADIARHWNVDADTAAKVIAAHHLPTIPSPFKRARYAWIDVWRVEKVSEDDRRNPDLHPILMEPLATARDLAHAYGCTTATIRNWSKDKTLPAIRIARSWRYRRPPVADATEIEAETPDPREYHRTSKNEEDA